MQKEEILMAYLAGAMDGDGSFSICKSMKDGNSPLYYPVIQLSNACEKIIDILKETFGGRKHERKPYIAKDGGNRRTNYHWMIQRRALCLPMLEKIIPYLVLKKQRAEYLMAFILENPFKRGSVRIDQKTLEFRELSYLKMREFNDERIVKKNLTKRHAKKDNDSEVFWSYLAGLMDTDGSFTITKRKAHTNMTSPSYSTLIQLTSVDVKCINYILENFQGGKIRLRKGKNCKTGFCYRYVLTNTESVSRFCKKIMPFLILKPRQAEILLDFCENKKEIKYCRAGIPEEELEFREKCRTEIINLNMGSINFT